MDANTILKAAQMISGEINLKHLLSTMTGIVMENAGAEKCMILLEDQGEFFIEARTDTRKKIVSTMESVPFQLSPDISAAAVHYATRTREPLILDNAWRQGALTEDPYIKNNRIKSVLCLPVIHQQKLTAVLYMENNLTTGAFTKERIEILTMLSTQIAISIENARVYQTVERAVAKRTAELKEAVQNLTHAKDELWGEMQLAKRIQTALLPRSPAIPEYEISAFMNPSREVGGDYYDVISMGRTNWVVIGDVSGHGVAAGLVMMMVQTAIQVILKNTPDLKPAALLSAINETIYHNIRSLDEDKYMTLTVFAVHENGRIDFSGLHQDIMIYRAAFDDVALIETRGFWIGITRDIRQMVTDDSFHMAVGDTLLIFTDGITEAVSNCSGEGEISDNRVFGDARLKSVFKTLGHLNPDNIKDGILQALENYECRDDVTMVILKRTL